MSTRSQKRRNFQQESAENVSETGNVSETITFPVLVENVDLGDQGVAIAGPSSAKYPRIKNSVLEGLRASLKEEMHSKIRGLLAESQRGLFELLEPKTGEIVREQDENTSEGEPREF